MPTKRSYLLLLLFLSGAGTLVLEVAWFRRMAQIAGATAIAMGAVLAAVIGGMAVGALLFGRRADRSPHPLRLYGLLEAGIALAAIVTPWLLDASRVAFDGLLARFSDHPALLSATQFLLATLLLAGPALLMGGSLPAIACALRGERDRRGRDLGWLYASNTLGAVVGTFAAGFFLLPTLGLSGATRSAAVLSGVAALLAFLPRRGPVAPAALRPPGPPAAGTGRAIALYAASGFLGLAAEVAFTRRLVLVLGSTTYAFTTTLGVFLLGIGLGGAVGAILARRRSGHLRMLEVSVGVTAALFSLSTLLVYLLPRLYVTGVVAWADTFEEALLLRFLLSLVVLLPGAVGLGVSFPLAAHLAAAGRPGAGIGRLYAANTIASVAGSTAAVFLLLPALGPDRAIVVTAIGVAGFAALRPRPVTGLLLLVAVAGLVPPPAPARERLLSGVFSNTGSWLLDGRIDERLWREGADFPFVAEGREATVAVFRWYGRNSLLINGKAVANNEVLDVIQHLTLLGHLPMAVHPDPQKVLVVGLGMGTTLSACEMHGPESVRVVELEKEVVAAAAWLGVRPRHVTIADARSWLRATEEKFDVITSDPIHPWVRGGGDLYSLEYFTSCRERLAPGGVCCQWLPLHQLGVTNLRHIVRTFTAAFPGSAAFYGGGDLVLIGTTGDSVPEPRVLSGAPAEALARLGLADLAALRVADGDRLREVAGDGPLLTDDSLRLEFSAPRFVDFHAFGDCLEWLEDLWQQPPFPFNHVLDAQRSWARGDVDRMWLILSRALRAAPEDRFLVTQIGELRLYEVDVALARGELDRALSTLDRARECLPGDVRLLGLEADVRVARGETHRARELLRRLRDRSPDSEYLERRIAALGEGDGPDELAARRDRAVLDGMAWMEEFIGRGSHLEELQTDPAFLFLELAETAGREEVRRRALAVARRFAGPTAARFLALDEPLGPGETVDLIELLPEADALGLDVGPLRERALAALARHRGFAALYGVALDGLADASSAERFDVAMSVYSLAKAEAVFGEEFRVEPGIREVLDVLGEVPLVSAEGDRFAFREDAYLATHVAYLLNHYNRLRLDRADAPWVVTYLRANFRAVLEAGDVELVGEFLDVFRTLGGTEENDGDIRAGTEFLLSVQNPDGSWGSPAGTEDVYDALHLTWCAVCGLCERRVVTGTAYERLLRAELSRDSSREPDGDDR